MNKKGTTYTTLLTALVVISMLGVGLFVTINEVRDNYAVATSSDFNATFNNFSATFDDVTSSTTTLENTSRGVDASQTATSGFNVASAISTVKLVWNFFGFIENLVNSLGAAIGIQGFWIVGLLSIITIVLTFLFIKAVFGVDV